MIAAAGNLSVDEMTAPILPRRLLAEFLRAAAPSNAIDCFVANEPGPAQVVGQYLRTLLEAPEKEPFVRERLIDTPAAMQLFEAVAAACRREIGLPSRK